jgi:exopolyphosphatase/guanosine-5'-triphosphate,3'-diphosphate pyrophosphatase
VENLFKRTNRVFSRAAQPERFSGQGRLEGFGPIAVIDIGSNSVRLVAYERLSRALTPLYNEKVLCGLGRGLAKTGQLSDASVELTLATLVRFRHLADQMHIKSLRVIATAAVREASNGEAFMQNAERILSAPLTILSGDEEARAAALGVQSGFYQPDGIVGDLGGGSLELVEVTPGHIGEGVSHKLGVIRMQEESEGEAKRAYRLALDRLRQMKRRPALLVARSTWWVEPGATLPNCTCR